MGVFAEYDGSLCFVFHGFFSAPVRPHIHGADDVCRCRPCAARLVLHKARRVSQPQPGRHTGMRFPKAAFIAERPADHTGEVLVPLIHAGNSTAYEKSVNFFKKWLSLDKWRITILVYRTPQSTLGDWPSSQSAVPVSGIHEFQCSPRR